MTLQLYPASFSLQKIRCDIMTRYCLNYSLIKNRNSRLFRLPCNCIYYLKLRRYRGCLNMEMPHLAYLTEDHFLANCPVMRQNQLCTRKTWVPHHHLMDLHFNILTKKDPLWSQQTIVFHLVVSNIFLKSLYLKVWFNLGLQKLNKTDIEKRFQPRNR